MPYLGNTDSYNDCDGYHQAGENTPEPPAPSPCPRIKPKPPNGRCDSKSRLFFVKIAVWVRRGD